VAVSEPGGRGGGTDGGEGGGTGENKGGGGGGSTGGNKGGGTGGEAEEGTGERISGGPLLGKKKGFAVLFFLGRLRPRPLSPRPRRVILPVKTIKLKKGLIKNKTRIYNNAKKMRPRYANKIKCQNNI